MAKKPISGKGHPAKNATNAHPEYGKRIIKALRQMTQCMDTHSRQLLKHQNITVPQVLCLDELRMKGAMTVAVLAASLHLTASTTVGIIDRLEERKLVKRNRCGNDRRLVFVEITDKGMDFLLSTPHLLHNRIQETLRKLELEEQIELANHLERLVSLLIDEKKC